MAPKFDYRRIHEAHRTYVISPLNDYWTSSRREGEKHAGRWVVIVDEKIAVDGESFREAHRKATSGRRGAVRLPVRSQEQRKTFSSFDMSSDMCRSEAMPFPSSPYN